MTTTKELTFRSRKYPSTMKVCVWDEFPQASLYITKIGEKRTTFVSFTVSKQSLQKLIEVLQAANNKEAFNKLETRKEFPNKVMLDIEIDVDKEVA